MKKRFTKVLVVDDLKSMRRTLGGILEDEGHHVVTAENGYQAIESVKGNHFDIIFMDIKMPGMNGVQAFSEIRKLDPRVTVVIMTAYDEKELVEKAIRQGARTCIYKPFDMEQILSLVEDANLVRVG
jgi:DNA-binding NtrC family response regulator